MAVSPRIVVVATPPRAPRNQMPMRRRAMRGELADGGLRGRRRSRRERESDAKRASRAYFKMATGVRIIRPYSDSKGREIADWGLLIADCRAAAGISSFRTPLPSQSAISNPQSAIV